MSGDIPSDSAIFESAACGLLLTDVDGTIRRVNATFCSWVGRTSDELVGNKRLQDLLTIGAQLFFQTHWAPLMQMQASVSEVKLDVLHHDGRRIPMLFNAVRDASSATPHDHVAVFVVTDRQKYEQELLKARRVAEDAHQRQLRDDQRKDEFLATLAHELRNPLAPMRNVVHILTRMELIDSKLIWAREVLDRQVGQMTHLVDDLLDASRIATGKVRLRVQRLNLADALASAIEAAQPLMDSASHTLVREIPSTPVMIDADPTRLAQMVVNLLNNAAKYTADGGRIVLRVRVVELNVEISVTDNGVGIAPEQLQEVFEMFAQVKPSIQRTEGGLGIGLALVRGLALLHGGTVRVESPGMGLGSEFTLALPIAVSE